MQQLSLLCGPGCRALLHRQVSGRLPQGVVAYARHREALSLQQVRAPWECYLLQGMHACRAGGGWLLARSVRPETNNPALVHPTTRGAVQLAALSTHAWGRPALSARGQVSIPPEGREGGASIQALQFDAGGELLVAASDEGVLSVHSTQQLMQDLARCAGLGGTAAAAAGMYLSS